MRGYEADYTGLIPPYIVLTEPQGRFSEAGFLGRVTSPSPPAANPAQARFAVEGVVAPGIFRSAPEEPARAVARPQTRSARRSPAARRWNRCTNPKSRRTKLILGDAGKILICRRKRVNCGSVRAEHVRTIVPGRAAAGRARRPVRHDQLQRLDTHNNTSRPCAGNCRTWTKVSPRCSKTCPSAGSWTAH